MGSLRSLQKDKMSPKTEVEKKEAKEATGFLIDACMKGTEDEILSLLKKGADPRVPNSYGSTTLWYAARKGFVKVLKNLRDQGIDLNETTKVGFTPLMAASEDCQANVVRFLLSEGADVDQKMTPNPNTHGWTALACALSPSSRFDAHHDRMKTLTLLLEKGSDANFRDRDGISILEMAESLRVMSNAEREEIVELLEKYGAKLGGHGS